MGPLMIIGAVPRYNIYSVIVLTFEAADEGSSKRHIENKNCSGMNLHVKNPIIIAIVLGIISALLKIEYPVLVNKTVNNVAQMATPLALIALGMQGLKRKSRTCKNKTDYGSITHKAHNPAGNIFADSPYDRVWRRRNDRYSCHACGTGNTELLHNGKKYE